MKQLEPCRRTVGSLSLRGGGVCKNVCTVGVQQRECWEHSVQGPVWTGVHMAGFGKRVIEPPPPHTNFSTAVKNEDLERINQSCRAPLHNPHQPQGETILLLLRHLCLWHLLEKATLSHQKK